MDVRTFETVVALKRPIQTWTRGWMISPDNEAYAAALGLQSGRQLWICGRAGLLGDVPWDVAVAGLAWIAPDDVRKHWEALPAGLNHRDVGLALAERAFDWGERTLPEFGDDRLKRLDDLGRRVVDAPPASVGVLFAAWRALPPPDGIGARVALTTHLLRELRGAAHIAAVTATGLTPLQAVLASTAPPPRSGPEWAEHMGWEGPFEDVTSVLARREEAEDLTNRILTPFFGVLDADELAELADLLVSIREAIDM